MRGSQSVQRGLGWERAAVSWLYTMGTKLEREKAKENSQDTESQMEQLLPKEAGQRQIRRAAAHNWLYKMVARSDVSNSWAHKNHLSAR